ncbi:E3 ubiquitin-protein ligase TRIM35-like isoform X2 [Dunckerocampus dactyliophorus]|uniref:E3 ubiquitin-protein ligase TRIM35-like isoform X2 n=1 Tax=Dunckerocampus dactyliophorus TaxID=161453 RepID=UPI0024064A7C|nr:E3 ubiquitin-protein ligase TRIM35-like isoform X2 [Dunckerocampus dactyliophorus]
MQPARGKPTLAFETQPQISKGDRFQGKDVFCGNDQGVPALMACSLSLPEADLTCTICLQIYKYPVVLKCSHSFCSLCLKQHWAHQRPPRSCPLCRSLSVDEPVPSLTIRNLCEFLVQDDDDDELFCGQKDMCALHREGLKLFCLVDQEPICVVCSKSKRHKRHDCCLINEAIDDVKAKLKSQLCSLLKTRDVLDKTKKSLEDAKVHIQVEAQHVQKCSGEEFARLHRFLQAEEDARMVMLQEEVEEKGRAMRQKIGKANASLQSVCASIRALEDRLAMTGISVLRERKDSAASTARDASPVDMLPMAGRLIDEAKYLGSLSFHVWEKMRHIIKW